MTPDYILIIASSGRMLAEAAKNAGLQPLVIDLFADLDTQACAVAFQQINSLSSDHLAPAVDYFIQHYTVTQLVYGSGFESYPDSLFYLQTRLTLLGNTPETFIRLQNKVDFFAVLDELNIHYPETVFEKPNDNQDWLIKPMQGQGGIGIQRTRNTNLGLDSKDIYWQKYQQGSQHSVLFLANGQQLQIIGFNTQWTTRLSDSEEFVFAGIVNHCELADCYQARIIDWLTKLVPIFKLTGLNSLDFIKHHKQSYVLEINPRPPASMQLYDADLLLKHIHAKNINIEPLKLPPPSFYTGYQIIYAQQDIQIPNDYIWDNNCLDLPPAGLMCKTGQPICSIIVRKKQARAVMQALNNQQHKLQKGLYSHG